MLGRLEHGCVAAEDRRERLPGDVREWRVERDHERSNPDWTPKREHGAVRHRCRRRAPVGSPPLAGHEQSHLDCGVRLASSDVEGLPVSSATSSLASSRRSRSSSAIARTTFPRSTAVRAAHDGCASRAAVTAEDALHAARSRESTVQDPYWPGGRGRAIDRTVRADRPRPRGCVRASAEARGDDSSTCRRHRGADGSIRSVRRRDLQDAPAVCARSDARRGENPLDVLAATIARIRGKTPFVDEQVANAELPPQPHQLVAGRSQRPREPETPGSQEGRAQRIAANAGDDL